MYILIDKSNLYQSRLFTCKQQIANSIDIHRNTLNKLPYENNNYIIIECKAIKSNNKGRFK
jgi:hypothetical protein